jgi:integrase
MASNTYTSKASNVSNVSNDGWQTVGRGGGFRTWNQDTTQVNPAFGRSSGGAGRPMPAAFSSQRKELDPRREERKAQEAHWAAVRAQDERSKKAAAAAEAKRQEQALNFASEQSYPSLGGGAPAAAKPKPALNFKATVETMKERVASEEEAQAIAAALARQEEARQERERSRFSGLRFQAPRDLIEHEEEDYEFSDDGYAPREPERGYRAPPCEDSEEPNANTDFEQNADLYSNRRRGDHGVW